MARITLMQINDAIAGEFIGETVTLPGVADPVTFEVQSYDELTEGVGHMPLIQVFLDDSDVDWKSETDRTTWNAGVQQAELTFLVWCIARRRSQLAEDSAAAMICRDKIDEILEAQTDCPPFGLAGIKNFRWSSTFETFNYASVVYVGSEHRVTVRVF